MDTNAIMLFFVLLIAAIIITCFDENFLLWIIGFALVAVGFKASDIFGVSMASYDGFGALLILPFYILSIICFLKTYTTWRDIKGRRVT